MKKMMIVMAMVVGLLMSGCNDTSVTRSTDTSVTRSTESPKPKYYSGDEAKRIEKEEIERNRKLQAQENPLQIQRWTYTLESHGYSYIRGRVKNIGEKPIRYFEVHAVYMDNNGNVLDTAYTNSGEMLQPGWSKEFEIMHKERPEYKSATIRIENIR